MSDGNNPANSINWNDVLKKDARSIDGVNLGQVQGLFEPFVIIERGTLSKEQYYIPKSVIERYDSDALYFRLTVEDVKNNCLRNSPPSEEEAKQIEITTEMLAMTPRIGRISKPENQEEEILRKLKTSASEFKETILLGAKYAKEKIQEKQAQKDAQKISKMGEIATSFANSFDEVMSEIRTTRTYAEQEQIYNGFIKLLEQQRELVVARRELATKLKSSVTESLSVRGVSDRQLLESPETEITKDQEQEESIAEGSQGLGGIVLSDKNTTISNLSAATADRTQNKVGNRDWFMVIKPPPIKHSKVAVKPSQKRHKRKK
jgi:hypothetical protein